MNRKYLVAFLVAVFGLVASQQSFAATIFTETFESDTVGSPWADGTGASGGWSQAGVAFDAGDIVNTPVFEGSKAGQANGGSSAQTWIWSRFNPTNGSNTPTDPVWVEFYVNHDFTADDQGWAMRVPTTNNVGATRLQVGFFADDASSSTLFVSGAALGNTLSNFTLNDGQWAHIVAEIDFNGASSTVKVYAKQVAAGDTSALATGDLLSLGGSSSATFSWNGTILDSLAVFNDFINGAAGTVTIDNIAVHTDNIIVPEPASAALIGIGLGLVATRRKSRR